MSENNPSPHRAVSLADSPAAARVADPVLSTVARGYRNAAHAHTALFPIVDVTVIGGQIVAFGAEAFAKRDLVRAPGADMQLLEVGYAGEPYTLEQRALAGLLPIERLEEGQSVPGIDLGRVTAARVLASISLQVEIKAADLATASGNYSSGHTATLSGSDQWDHKGALPAKKVKAAKETVLSDIGLRPNTLVVSGAVHNALTENPDVVDRVKHVSGLKEGVLVNEAALANYFDVEHYVVGRMTKGEPGDFSEIWGKNAVLAYTDRGSMDMGAPTFGYTYRRRGYPVVNAPYWLESRRSWVYPVVTQDTPVIAGKDAGYLFTAVIS